jgi:hypothetical protein
MAVEQLELREDATLLGEIRDELVPKQMQIDPLLDTCRLRVVFDDMAKASCRVQPTPIRFEEIRGALGAGEEQPLEHDGVCQLAGLPERVIERHQFGVRCKTVAGVLKELTIFAIIYNLVRMVIRQSAQLYRVDAARISFLDALR